MFCALARASEYATKDRFLNEFFNVFFNGFDRFHHRYAEKIMHVHDGFLRRYEKFVLLNRVLYGFIEPTPSSDRYAVISY